MAKAMLTRHNHRNTSKPLSRVSGSHTCTHSPFGVALQEQAPLAVCSPPALPVGSDSLPYISSQFNGANGCFVVILTRPAENCHSLRCSSGCLLSLIWPISPPSLPVSINSVLLSDCVTQKGGSLSCVAETILP